MTALPLALALLSLAIPAFADEPEIRGDYLDKPLEQSCGIFGSAGNLLCSATIIGPRQALSAAHCYMSSMNPSTLEPSRDKRPISTLRCGSAKKEYEIIVAMPDLDYFGNHHAARFDRMLIAPREAFDVEGLPLADQSVYESMAALKSRNCRIAGWGDDNQMNAGAMHVARIKHIQYRNLSGVVVMGFDSNRFASGDSGGSVYCKRDGRWTLVAVIAATSMSNDLDQGPTVLLSRDHLVDPFTRRLAEVLKAKAEGKLILPEFDPMITVVPASTVRTDALTAPGSSQ